MVSSDGTNIDSRNLDTVSFRFDPLLSYIRLLLPPQQPNLHAKIILVVCGGNVSATNLVLLLCIQMQFDNLKWFL